MGGCPWKIGTAAADIFPKENGGMGFFTCEEYYLHQNLVSEIGATITSSAEKCKATKSYSSHALLCCHITQMNTMAECEKVETN